jgi:CheY-like chemotaxis protein
MDRERILYYADSSFPKALVERLTQRGYQVDSVRRGDDLLSKAFAEHVSLMIAFAEMPGLDGLSLCRDVKGNVGLKDIPVLIFAQRPGGDRQAFYAAGTEGYYEPPFDEVNITQRVDELLVDRSAARRMSTARLAIDYKLNTELMRLTARELQDSTFFLYAKSPLEPGTRLKFTLSVAGKTLIDAYGEVTRTDPFTGSATRPAGMWVRFNEMDDGSRRTLDGLARQRALANPSWEEISVEALADRIAAEMGAGATGGKDLLLERAGFDKAKVAAWQQAAYTHGDGEGESDLLDDLSGEARAALREASAVLHKLNYHLGRYAEFFYVGPVAAKRLSAHSEQVIARTESVADVLASLVDRFSKDAALSAGHPHLIEHLTLAQDWLIEKLVRLRTVIADVQRPPAFTQPTTSDSELCPTQELRYRCLGLVELLDFGTQNARKEYAKTLPADLDLSELSHFDVLALLEGKQPANAMHPDLGAWARTLVARTSEIHDFMRGRRFVREKSPEKLTEIAQAGEKMLASVTELQEHFLRDLRRLSDIRAVPRPQLAELSSTHRRLLTAAARLAVYFHINVPEVSIDYRERLELAARATQEVVPPAEGPSALVFPSLGGEPSATVKGGTSEPPPPRPSADRGPSRLDAIRDWIAADPKRKWILAGGGGALVCVVALVLWMLLAPSKITEGKIDVTSLRSNIPLKSCEVKLLQGSKERRRILRCVVDKVWQRQPMQARKNAVRDLLRLLPQKGIEVQQVLLYDPFDTELAIAGEGSVEVFDS